ncbi:YjbQ family protein [Olsenella sp. YH-ols2217]|uniref:YjbQ family protein n=1 Tax=Kribbibacterium absianum TaxID=3044210 RepID=A0ABT6ZJC1_9ACTN|nr:MULTISPECIES: YjbQ family protein [unclassified Olsenella]MDJ1121507.1 YjbQ family protein [Olsenella sp. YH-ols2216]MDJ1128997.1 YjbQ family protein [Olsenella sp. YH-ols2217]
MTVHKGTVTCETVAGKPTYVDITDGVRGIVAESGIVEGIAVVISCHTTCAVFSQEYDHDHTPAGDTFLQADLSDGLGRIFPEQHDWSTYRYPGLQHFEEVETWPELEKWLPGGDRTQLWNGDAHLRSVVVGSSQTFEVSNGALNMNGLASIYLVDFDRCRERTRRARVVVIGE